MKETEKITEQVMNKLGVTPSGSSSGSSFSGGHPDLGQALASLVTVARDSMSAWQTTMMFEHASDEMKRRMADAAMEQRLKEMQMAASRCKETPPEEVVVLDDDNLGGSSADDEGDDIVDDEDIVVDENIIDTDTPTL